MASPQAWCRVTIIGPGGRELGSCTLQGPGAPDLSTVDVVGRLALLAKRLGGGLILSRVSPGLRELLELSGLGVEMEREPEVGEETLRVQQGQEEGRLGDASL